MNDTDLALRFAVAIAIGVLLGLERERTKGEVGGAGVRTFALIALSGALSAYLDARLGISWMAPAMFVGLAALVIGMYVMTSMRGETGITTEVSALMAFLLGLLCEHGELQLAGGIAVAMALLLALKDWLHRLARRIAPADVEATLQFSIISLIVLPLVPDVNYGPPAAGRGEPVPNLADGRADFRAQLRQLPADQGRRPASRHRSRGPARRDGVKHRSHARILAAQPQGQ